MNLWHNWNLVWRKEQREKEKEKKDLDIKCDFTARKLRCISDHSAPRFLPL